MELNHAQAFSAALTAVAQLSQFDLKPDILEFYMTDLKPHGYDKAAKALRIMIRDMRPGKPFPSINEIIAAMGQAPDSDDNLAKDAAARIIQGVSKFGHCVGDNKAAEVKAWLGDLAHEIVQRQGGWNHICEVLTNQNSSQYQAQWRDLGRVLCDKARRGKLDQAPALPGSPVQGSPQIGSGTVNQSIGQLVAQITSKPPEKQTEHRLESKEIEWPL